MADFVLAAAVRKGVLTPAGLGAAGPAWPRGGPARVQVSGMPGLPLLARVAVPAFSIASRVSRGAALQVPAASVMTATVLPGWRGRAGSGPVVACAALGAVADVFVRAISLIPIHFRRHSYVPAFGGKLLAACSDNGFFDKRIASLEAQLPNAGMSERP